jgi:uncharacterized protein YecE (DUF72 family)
MADELLLVGRDASQVFVAAQDGRTCRENNSEQVSDPAEGHLCRAEPARHRPEPVKSLEPTPDHGDGPRPMHTGPKLLRGVLPLVRQLAEGAEEVHLLFNNNRSNYAVVNGLQMAEILELSLPGHG